MPGSLDCWIIKKFSSKNMKITGCHIILTRIPHRNLPLDPILFFEMRIFKWRESHTCKHASGACYEEEKIRRQVCSGRAIPNAHVPCQPSMIISFFSFSLQPEFHIIESKKKHGCRYIPLFLSLPFLLALSKWIIADGTRREKRGACVHIGYKRIDEDYSGRGPPAASQPLMNSKPTWR